MADWVRVARADALPPGQRLTVDVEGVAVLLFNLDGSYYAIENICSHDGGELGSGEWIGAEIICPRHGARFDVKSGAVTAPPAYAALAAFPVRLEAGFIEICDPRWD